MTQADTHPDHTWFRERIAEALANGLPADEQAQFDAHASTCEACRAELNAMRDLETKMTELFAPTMPRENLEERLIAAFRNRTARRLRFRIPSCLYHPAIRQAAVAA